MRSAKSISFTMITMMVPLVVSVISVPFYLEKIGAERYGALAIAWLLLGYVAQADFGIGRAVTQRISAMAVAERSSDNAARVIWSAIVFSALIGACGGIVIYFAADLFFSGPFEIDEGLRREMLDAVLLLAISGPLVNVYSAATGALLGAERVRIVALLNMFTGLTLQLFPLAAAYLIDVSMVALIAAALGARIVMTLPAGLFVWRTFLSGFAVRAAAADMRRLANFGAWIMVSSIVGPFMVISDRFVIGALIGAAAVAAYTIPFQIAYRTMVIPAAVMQVLFPQFAGAEAVAARGRAEQAIVLLGAIFAPVVIALICLAEPLLNLWLGPELDERSILIGQIILLGLWSNALAQVPFGLVQARGNPRYTALLHVIELPFYVALLWWLGTAYGLAGMAFAFSIRCFVDLVLLANKAALITRSILARLAPPAALVAMAFISSQVSLGLLARLLLTGALGAASLAAAWTVAPGQVRDRALALIGR